MLGYRVTEEDDTGVEIRGANPRDVPLVFVPVAEPKTVKNRIHIDVNPTDSDQEAELSRLTGLGATPVDVGQGTVRWHVLADPEGNEFCLLRSRLEP